MALEKVIGLVIIIIVLIESVKMMKISSELSKDFQIRMFFFKKILIFICFTWITHVKNLSDMHSSYYNDFI